MSKEQALSISLLGDFCVENKAGEKVNEKYNTQNLWSILKYLVMNRGKMVPLDVLSEVLWEDADCKNPRHAMQNLVYRLRKVLLNTDDDGNEYILYNNGCYTWNKKARYQLDVEDFENLAQDILDGKISGKSLINSFDTLASLYGMGLLPDEISQVWSVNFANHYRQLLYETAIYIINKLNEKEEYMAVQKICQAIIKVEPFEENFHMLLINAMMQTNQVAKAIAHYETYTAQLHNTLGVSPSEQLTKTGIEAYMIANKTNYDINSVLESMNETGKISGAFVCEYDVFCQLYKLNKRNTQRTGESIFLILLSIVDYNSNLPTEKILAKAMKLLKTSTTAFLRKGDVVSQYNKSQMLVMVSISSLALGQMVCERIKANFYKLYRSAPVIIKSSIIPIENKSDTER